ncbi:TPA: aspartate--tRNA(Asn) ligase [Candidatus Saccharibacteria bacterium]|nr:aspartate--tRNA(Asn) ligase [Candidatus Saccharibacteria bacterium]HIO87888.1 aspartate--tRNA(Asn) ligase [Candidatus Saccharibacteria bacterium]
MRVITNELKEHVDKKVSLHGWLHKKRKLGGLNFLLIRDRGGVAQVLVKSEQEMEKLRGMQIGSILKVEGLCEADERAPNGAEIHNPTLEVMVAVEDEPPIEIDKPLSHKPDNLDTLFEYRAIGLRNTLEQTVFKIRADVLQLIREWCRSNGFTEIQTPKLIAGDAEGGATVFKLDYFGKEATLAQSPQLYKQMMVGVFERVFEIGSAYRAEPSATSRHMSELMMLDMEWGFVKDHDDVFKLTEKFVGDVLRKLYSENADQLKSLRAPELVLTDSFPRFTMQEIHELYQKETGIDVSKEVDLTPAEERWICEYAKKQHGCEAVFATNLPVSKSKFYHMRNDDGTARSGDLLFRGVEIATVPQREHRYDVLVGQMKESGVDPEDPGFKYYLQAFKYGLPPHGGFGFGIDRFVQLILGLENVKEATLFPRDINRLTP